MRKKIQKVSILLQVAILFAAGVLMTGLLTYFTEHSLSYDSVKQKTEQRAAEIADEVRRAVTEYPAYPWLLQYWLRHPEELEIEYDVDFSEGTETEEKCRTLAQRHPELQLRYASEAQLEVLPEDDQKLCAEIVYSWLITRVNEIKRANRMDYIFCVWSEPPYDRQFFLFSGAEPGAVRGTDYEEVYPLGNVVTVGEDQQAAMASARQNSNHLADAGDYEDYYVSFCELDGGTVFIGLTYSLADLHTAVETGTRTGTTYAVLHQIFLSLLCLSLIFWFVLRPLKKVQTNIRLFKNTKDSKSVVKNLAEIHALGEIRELSGDVSDLALEMDDYMHRVRTITAEKERIGTELALATRIQAAMLPHVFPPFPDKAEIDLYAVMDPAKEVGGDFYDFFLVDEDHLCLVIADVSGKGIPAALFMMVSKIILQSCAMLGRSPAEILAKTNEAICSNNPEDMFVTVWVGILELSTGRLTAANAGHEYPILMEPGGRFELLKDRHGLVIGGMESARYRQYELQLRPGAKLFVYTDGVPEATDAERKMFGTDRLLETLNRARDGAPEQILRQVRGAVDGFVREAEQFDDLTMLCLQYNGTAADRARAAEELIIEATLENIPQVMAFVDAKLQDLACPKKARIQIKIATDELFSNIARYAYDPATGPAAVRVELEQDPRAALITFTDQGKPYDPLGTKVPDVSAPASLRKPGGLGVYLVRKTMDDIRYEYKDGQNILRIRKIIGGES